VTITAAMAAKFVLPPVEENQDGWGPLSVPKQFDGVPFMPFSKGERLGRIADFSAPPGRGMYGGEHPRMFRQCHAMHLQ
jgi:translation initiation factor 3 subunit D